MYVSDRKIALLVGCLVGLLTSWLVQFLVTVLFGCLALAYCLVVRKDRFKRN